MNKYRPGTCFRADKAVSGKHTRAGIAGKKQEYESKGSYSCSVYADKTAIGTLVFSKNHLYNESTTKHRRFLR
ncbi:MAG: hypothetical protein DBX53_01165 [Clostridiales bacterium]|nr:MAG: hypothetical protein DBX53_01165 [Clostridiales bacterium]